GVVLDVGHAQVGRGADDPGQLLVHGQDSGREGDQQVDDRPCGGRRHHTFGTGTVGCDHLDQRSVVDPLTPAANPLLYVGGEVLEPGPPTLVDHQLGPGLAGNGVVRATSGQFGDPEVGRGVRTELGTGAEEQVAQGLDRVHEVLVDLCARVA